jgi:hypothetical protein
MCVRKIIPLRYLILSLIMTLLMSRSAYSQVMDYGIKLGSNISWVRIDDDPDYRKATKITPVPGFNIGASFSFKLKKKYFLHAELLYSTKGQWLTENDLEPDLYDEWTIYRYIDLPLTYNIYFNGKLNVRRFKWYVGIGPNFSYWLGGKGVLKHYEFKEFDLPDLEYKIKFGERGDDTKAEHVYIDGANRLQLGLNIGGGMLFEPANGSKIMVDLRFELGHTWLATSEGADYFYPDSYDTNLQARNMGVRVSVMYMLERSTDKKTRNKGKSTIKNKGKRRK